MTNGFSQRRAWWMAVATAAVFASCGHDTPSNPTPPACAYAAAPLSFTPCLSAIGELTVSVTTAQGCAWFSGVTAPWITVTDGASGRGPGTVRFRVSDNWDAPRSGSVMVWGAPGPATVVTVSQAGCIYFATPDTFAFAVAGGSSSFDVLQQSQPTSCGGPLQNACRWSAIADSAWISVTTPMPRQGDDRVSFTVAPNDSSLARTGTIAVYGKTVRISQAGR